MILLTGFEPFTTGQGLVLTHNPTADIVQRVADRWNTGDGTPLVSDVLPVSFRRTKIALTTSFDETRPRIWVGLGFAPHRTTLDIEAVALNFEHALRGDNDGDRPWMRPVVPGGPVAYETRLPLSSALHTFEAHGVEAGVSTHAGAFLCNQVFYLGCHACEAGALELAAFIHVPPMNDYSLFESGLAALLKLAAEGPPSLAQ